MSRDQNNNSNESKWCSGHRKQCPLSEFTKDRNRKDGCTSSCRGYRLQRRIERARPPKDLDAQDLLRFFDKILGDGCWTWKGSVNSKGYGVFGLGTNQLAHRVSYQFFNQCQLGPDLQVHHTCENVRCSNPAHLKAMTAEAHCDATRALRTHCARGHAFDAANTYVNPMGRRQCRRCAANTKARRRCPKRGGQASTE